MLTPGHGQRTLPALRDRERTGRRTRPRATLPARLQPQSQPYRTTLETGEEALPDQPLLRKLRRLPPCIDTCIHYLTTTAAADLHSLLTLNFQLFSK
jgi:hypothetical protein